MPDTESQNLSLWTPEHARKWWADQPWRVGCNFTPSHAINQLEMWQAESFDPEINDRELGWAASLGFNIVRVYLHDLLWTRDAAGFLERVDQFLELAASHNIAVMLVLFDDVWCVDSKLGPQPEPYPGRHNSGWVAGPGLAALEAYPKDSAIRERLENYVRGVVGAFAQDERVLVWDVYNEPGGYPSPGADPVGEACLPLLTDVFKWVRELAPTQPITSGLWENPLNPLPPAIEELQLASSDVVSFHHYGPIEDLESTCTQLASKTERPLICTEYLARPMKSRFESHLPFFKEMSIGAINWGLVSGKTQTIYPWWSWFDKEPAPEPEVWFHDILRPDGTPFDPDEVAFLHHILKQ